MNRLLFLSLLCGTATVSFADGTSTAVVAAGHCENFDLTRAVGEFTHALKAQPEVQVVELDTAFSRLGRTAGRSVEEVQRQLAVAEDHFYRGQYEKMAERLDVAFVEVARLPPGRPRWHLYAAAWNLEALARSRLKKRGSIEDAYRNILRLDTTYKLDPDYVAPSMIQLFEQTRKRVAAEKKHRLSITTSPVGAKVYIDGREFRGQVTPLTVELPQGIYAVAVEKDGRFSLPREIDVSAMKETFIDLGFEGSVETGRSLCLAIDEDEQQRLNAATRLGSLLDADQVVLLRQEKLKDGPAWLTATAVVGSAKVREGGLEVHASEGLRAGAMTALARFIATGEMSGLVKSPPPPRRMEATSETAANIRHAPPPAEPPPGSIHAPAPSTRTAGLAALGTGGVLAAAGGAFVVVGAIENKRLADLRSNGRSIPEADAPKVRAMADAAALKQGIGFVAVGLGVASAGAGAYLILKSRTGSTASPQVTILPTRDGAHLGITGTLPW